MLHCARCLQEVGYTFQSQTDTEVLVHLIDEIMKEESLTLDGAVRQALTRCGGDIRNCRGLGERAPTYLSLPGKEVL